MKEIYKASLLCLEPGLRSGMTEEFEKLKKEFMYELFAVKCKLHTTFSDVLFYFVFKGGWF